MKSAYVRNKISISYTMKFFFIFFSIFLTFLRSSGAKSDQPSATFKLTDSEKMRLKMIFEEGFDPEMRGEDLLSSTGPEMKGPPLPPAPPGGPSLLTTSIAYSPEGGGGGRGGGEGKGEAQLKFQSPLFPWELGVAYRPASQSIEPLWALDLYQEKIHRDMNFKLGAGMQFAPARPFLMGKLQLPLPFLPSIQAELTLRQFFYVSAPFFHSPKAPPMSLFLGLLYEP